MGKVTIGHNKPNTHRKAILRDGNRAQFYPWKAQDK
jgi:hypothetical protein